VSRRILHVQIEKRGVREFAAYDNFLPSCVVLRQRVNGGVSKRVSFETQADGPEIRPSCVP
jgi:hypothetical protein